MVRSTPLASLSLSSRSLSTTLRGVPDVSVRGAPDPMTAIGRFRYKGCGPYNRAKVAKLAIRSASDSLRYESVPWVIRCEGFSEAAEVLFMAVNP